MKSTFLDYREAFRTSTEVLDAVANALPKCGDWSTACVADYISQHYCRRIVGATFYMDFRDMPRRDQWATAKAVCELLCRQGRAERAIGIGDRGREAITYNGV
jgi:hypothetical protein